jgi:hypothetical protein
MTNDTALKDVARSLNPYSGGNELLRALHDLDIGDKHITIVQAAASSRRG